MTIVANGESGASVRAKLNLGLREQVTVTVSSAEVLAIFSSPKTIIAAPGVGKAIQVLDFVIEYKFNTAAYVGGNAQLNFDGADTNFPIDGFSIFDLLAATESQFVPGLVEQKANGGITIPLEYARTTIENKALKLIGFTSNPTVGDGVLYFTIGYRTYTFQG